MDNFKEYVRKLGDRINEIRLAKNISLEVLSLDSKIDVCILEKIELGSEDSYVDDIIKIAHSLNVEVTELFSDKPLQYSNK